MADKSKFIRNGGKYYRQICFTNILPDDGKVYGLTNDGDIQIAKLVKMDNFNYSQLIDKPQINSIELSGNKSLDELGIQAKGDYATSEQLALKADVSSIPTKVSQLTNDSGFITKVPDTVQLKSDDSLITTDKTVVGAINEVNNNKLSLPNTISDNSSQSITIATVKPNTNYFYNILTSLTITSVEDSLLESNIVFTAGDEITVSIPASLEVIGDYSFEANKKYVISFWHNIMIVGEVKAQVQ